MPAPLILNQSQAEAVYSAMCALNNVYAMCSVHIRTNSGHFIEIHEDEMGIRLLACEVDLPATEVHTDQSAFAAAYGLDGKQPRTAVYTAGIGWQVQDSQGRRGNFETEAEALAA